MIFNKKICSVKSNEKIWWYIKKFINKKIEIKSVRSISNMSLHSLLAAHEKKAKKSKKSPKKKIRKIKEKKKDPKVKATHLCDTCGKHLKSRSGLKSHISAVHDKLKPHACTICEVDFVKIIIKFFFLNLIKRN